MKFVNEHHGNRTLGSSIKLTNSYPSNGIEDTATLNPVIRDSSTISNLTHQMAGDSTIYCIAGVVTTVVIAGAVLIGKSVYSKHKSNENYNATLADFQKLKNDQISSESILSNPC